MSWSLSARSIELCNCTMLCRCWFGPATPDQGFCAGAFVFDIQRGESDGVDLSGRRVVFAAEWPGDFWSGQGTARVYVDDGASDEQQRHLEAIFGGRNGGPMEAVGSAVISTWLPSSRTKIDVDWAEKASITIGDVASLTIEPLKDPAGQPTVVRGAAAQAAFLSSSMQVGSSKGSRMADPQMRAWEGNSATIHELSWSA